MEDALMAMSAGTGAEIHQLLWQVARANADKVAIEDGAQSLNYRQLMVAATKLAQEIGASPDGDVSPFVAVLAKHSSDLVIGILAAVLAGKAYLPLDPGFPAARLNNIVGSLAPRCIISDAQSRCLAQSLANDGQQILVSSLSNTDVSVAGDLDVCEQQVVSTFASLKAPRDCDPAYALTTSGTTGTPKTIVHTRASLLRSARHYCRDLNISAADKVALSLPCSYTPAAFCIFGAFLTGATLSVFDIKSESTTALIDWIEQHQVTLLYSTATIFRRLINTAESAQQLQSLRDIHVVGEPLFTSDVALYQQSFGHLFTVHNGLGTSETSCLTRFKLDSNTQLSGSQVPVGVPYDDVTLQLIDADGQPVGAGEIGELVVTCPFFASGYWQQPELSAEKFKIIPGEPTSRVAYYTGDRAKLLADGNLLYIGRDDAQVKLNGQRIELGEIEATLLLHPKVNNVAVMLHTIADTPQLVAFVATNATDCELRRSLAEKLPHYMVPARFVLLETLPLNASGKVDRKALKDWRFDSVQDGPADTELPASMLELRVLNCFRDVLGKELNVNSNFFAEGGDSFKAIELALELENAVSAPINISILIESPTVRLLTAEIEKVLYQGQSGVIASLHNKKAVDDQPEKQARAMVCLPGLFGDAFSFRAVIGRFQDEMPIYALEYPGFENMGKPLDSLEDIVQICFDEVQAVYPEGDVVLVCYSLGGVIGFELARKLTDAGRHVESLILLDCYTPKAIKRKYLLDCVREPLKELYKKVVGKKDEFDAVFSRHDHLNRILTRAVYKYKPKSLMLPRALLVIATAERSVTVEYQQWWQLIKGEFKSSRIDCGHLDLITKDYAPRVCDEIIDHDPMIFQSGKRMLSAVS